MQTMVTLEVLHVVHWHLLARLLHGMSPVYPFLNPDKLIACLDLAHLFPGLCTSGWKQRVGDVKRGRGEPALLQRQRVAGPHLLTQDQKGHGEGGEERENSGLGIHFKSALYFSSNRFLHPQVCVSCCV